MLFKKKYGTAVALLLANFSAMLQANNVEDFWSKSQNAEISAVRRRADDIASHKILRCIPSFKSDEHSKVPKIALKYASISLYVDEMFDLDQNARLMDQMAGYAVESKANAIARRVDQMNLPSVKEIFRLHGILKPSEFGLDTSQKYMALVIHADRDRGFQLEVLSRINSFDGDESDKIVLASAARLIKDRNASVSDHAVVIPYRKPNSYDMTNKRSCMATIFKDWYPWYVQEHLNKSLLIEARSGTFSK